MNANLLLIYFLILVDTELTLCCFAQAPSSFSSRWWVVALALTQCIMVIIVSCNLMSAL